MIDRGSPSSSGSREAASAEDEPVQPSKPAGANYANSRPSTSGQYRYRSLAWSSTSWV